MKSRPEIVLAFVEAIERLGGCVEPQLVHGAPSVLVPPEHEEKARELIDQLVIDLRKLDPS